MSSSSSERGRQPETHTAEADALRSTPDAREIGPRLYDLVAALGSAVILQQPDGLFAVKDIDSTSATLGTLAPGVGERGMRTLLLAAVDELNDGVQHDGPVTYVTP